MRILTLDFVLESLAPSTLGLGCLLRSSLTGLYPIGLLLVWPVGDHTGGTLLMEPWSWLGRWSSLGWFLGCDDGDHTPEVEEKMYLKE